MIERFIEDYAEKGYQAAYHLCGNVEDAKELVQDAFVKLIRTWERYDEEQPLENYFLTIMRNLYFDGLKRYEKRHCVSLDVPAGESEDSMTYAESLPDEREEQLIVALERREEAALVAAALADLVPEHRAILTMVDMQDLTYEKVAEVVDCPLGTVRSRVSRARAAFKKALLARQGQEVMER